MEIQNNDASLQAHTSLPTQLKLAAAWTSFMFLYVYVDVLGFYRPGVVEDILAGVVWKFPITQTFLVIALVSISVPLLMIALSTVLAPRANRIANLVVAALYVPFSIFNAVGSPEVYYFWVALGLELVVLALIVRLAWTLPRATHRSRGWSRNAAAATR